MSTAKKTLYATIGAGQVAVSKARDLSARLVELPSQLGRAGSIRDLPKVAATIRTESTKRASAIVQGGTTLLHDGTTRVTGLVGDVRKRSAKEYQQLAKRGEKLVTSVKRSAPTKRATTQAKTAKAKVKAASTSVTKAAEAAGEAVSAAADKVSEATA